MHQYATICTTVKSYTKWLEPLLTSSIPNLHSNLSIVWEEEENSIQLSKRCKEISTIKKVQFFQSKYLIPIITSFVRKSAPIVALYWLENFWFTYRFIKLVFPTPESPRMITFNRTFFRVPGFDIIGFRGVRYRHFSARLLNWSDPWINHFIKNPHRVIFVTQDFFSEIFFQQFEQVHVPFLNTAFQTLEKP